MAKKEKKQKISGISQILAGLRQDRYKLDLRERDVQYECTHKKGNTFRLKRTSTEGVFRCKECGAKLDFRFLTELDSADKAKAAIKDWKKKGIQFANITKLQLSNKADDEVLKKIVKSMRSIAWIAEVFKVTMLKDLANKQYKGKKGGKGNKNNVVITGGGASIFRR